MTDDFTGHIHGLSAYTWVYCIIYIYGERERERVTNTLIFFIENEKKCGILIIMREYKQI